MNIITTEDKLKDLVSYYSEQDAFVFDVETVGDHRGDPRQNIITWIALATEGRVDVIPMGHPNGDYIRTEYPLLPSAQDRIIKGLPIRASDYSKDERKATKIFTEAPDQLTPGEVFKALNDKWISGTDFKNNTLFEDIMFLDRASRNIGDTLLLDIFDLRDTLKSYSSNMSMSVFTFISGILIKNNFAVMPLPAYVNFYNIQTVDGTTIPKPEGSLEFADNMWGTFLDVDYRNSGPKLICFYVGKPSSYLQLPKGNFRYRDDSFNMVRASENPLIENLQNKKDWALSNRCVGFNVDIGIRNQNIFYSFNISQDPGKATAESINTLLNMVNQASGRNVATQNNGVYNLYKNRSYQCTVTCLGNALLQPMMYFNLRHVPMFNGPYMITDVQHAISSGTFQTTFNGIRQGIFDLPAIDSFLQSMNANLLTKIEALITSKKDTPSSVSITDQGKSADAVQKANNVADTTNSCTSSLDPVYDRFVVGQTNNIGITPQEFADALRAKTNNLDLQYLIYIISYIRTYRSEDKKFHGYNNNFATISLTKDLGQSSGYFLPTYSCVSIGETTSKKSNSQPIANFQSLSTFIDFMISRLTNNIDRIYTISLDKYYVCYWPVDNVSESYFDSNVKNYGTLINTITSGVASAKSVGLSSRGGATVTPVPNTTANNLNTVPSPTPTCPPPTITSISPSTGKVGTIMVIKGTNLEFTTKVVINNVEVDKTTLYIIDGTALRVSVPANITTLIGNVVVTTINGQTTPSNTNKFTFIP